MHFKLQRRNNNMKKLVLALMFLMSTLAFAQDGRTRIEYYNQTSQTVSFYDNGSPVGDVIPNGFTSESVFPGTHNLVATEPNGSVSRTVALEDGERFQWTVTEGNAMLSHNTDLRMVAYTQYDGFAVNAPVPLVTTGPQQGTTHAGHPFTYNQYEGDMPNTDSYLAGAYTYDFAVTNADLDKYVDGFAGGVNGTVISRDTTFTISGHPAEMAVITGTIEGRAIRYAVAVTYKGNRAFSFIFGSFVDVVSNGEEFKTFFNSASIN
jgi:hypothetical protein